MHFKGFVGTMDMTKIIGLSTVFLSILLFEYSSAANQSPIVVYRASKIIPLDPDIPTAEAVAVRNE